jgi:hypothetical protein
MMPLNAADRDDLVNAGNIGQEKEAVLDRVDEILGGHGHDVSLLHS